MTAIRKMDHAIAIHFFAVIDEDLWDDHQLEFTQLDLEMSFVQEQNIY